MSEDWTYLGYDADWWIEFNKLTPEHADCLCVDCRKSIEVEVHDATTCQCEDCLTTMALVKEVNDEDKG